MFLLGVRLAGLVAVLLIMMFLMWNLDTFSCWHALVGKRNRSQIVVCRGTDSLGEPYHQA